MEDGDRLPVGGSYSFKAVERRRLFLGVRRDQGVWCMILAFMATVLTIVAAGFLWSVPVFFVVFFGLYRLCKRLCATNYYWFEYLLEGHGFARKVWLRG